MKIPIEIPLLARRIDSKSHIGTYYTVEAWLDGTVSCDCDAGSFGRFCKHKRAVLSEILKEYKQLKKNDTSATTHK